MSNGVVNAVCILVHVFNSDSRQHHEVCASQLPFLHGLGDVVPLVRFACMAV